MHGQVLSLNGQSTLLGILPSNYRALTPVESPYLYVPLNVLGTTNLSQRRNDNALLVAEGFVRYGNEQARAQLTAFVSALAGFPSDNQGMKDPARCFRVASCGASAPAKPAACLFLMTLSVSADRRLRERRRLLMARGAAPGRNCHPLRAGRSRRRMSRAG